MVRRRVRPLPAGRVVLVLLLAGLATSPVAPPPEGLLAERRDAYVRDLTACGRKKACLMHVPIYASAAAPASGIARRSRWSESQYDSVKVWIGPGEATRGWRSRDRDMVRDAFHAWTDAGAPVRFVFVSDSSRADVRVLWRDTLPDGRAGQATRFVDRRGWLRAATVELRLGTSDGRAPRPSVVRAIAMHEVGHLLGLEHSEDEHDLMAAWVTAREITPHDRAAMQALYGVGR